MFFSPRYVDDYWKIPTLEVLAMHVLTGFNRSRSPVSGIRL